jgi:hypothetical protein
MKIFAQLPNLLNQTRKKIIDIVILKSVILDYDQFLQGCIIWTVCNGRLVNRRIGFHFYLMSADRLKTVRYPYT